MKIFLFLLFMVFLPIVAVEHASAEVKFAWWVTIEFEPKAIAIENIPVNQIDPEWEKAEVLDWDKIPKDVIKSDPASEPIDINKENFSFVGDFNHDGIPDKALVGVYVARGGEKGKFLLILTKTTTDKWEKAFLEEDPGRAGFSILYLGNNDISWHQCLDCDYFCVIRWDGIKYTLDWDEGE